jgi:3-hydroxyacyl-CoA dehydrogenase/enoyl-CoA hydratase/3-hydroxybutyryl-CoA epimerase
VKALGKAPVVCRSSPGFVVTRVLFFYLNEAVRLRERISTVEIDEALRDFGWPMGPLRLIDEVGLDVTESIFRELEHYFPSRFSRTTTCARLLAANLAGRKNGAGRGFYRYDDGSETENDEVGPLIFSPAPAENNTRSAPQSRRAIVEALMRVMVDEAERCLAEGVVKSSDEVDFALLSGAGFPAFRGGLLHWARSGAKVD